MQELGFFVRLLGLDDIRLSLDGATPHQAYLAQLSRSRFCLCLRGDTASSSRLFAVIAAGCIPVIISDWIQLPFEELVDYSKFSVMFPESVVHNAHVLINFLREVDADSQRLLNMRAALAYAQQLLLFKNSTQQALSAALEAGMVRDAVGNADAGASQRGQLYEAEALQMGGPLNPASLALLEMLLGRKRYCDRIYHSHQTQASAELPSTTQLAESSSSATTSSSMCSKLYRRLELAARLHGAAAAAA